MSFDLSVILNEAETAEMKVINPASGDFIIGNDGQPWRITFAGANHQRSKDFDRAESLRMMKAQREPGGVNAKLKAAADQQSERNIDMLVARTIGWSPVAMSGQDFAFTPENARLLFSRSSAIRTQAILFLADEANFLPKQPES